MRNVTRERCPKCKQDSLVVNAGRFAIGVICNECGYSNIQGVL